MECRQAAPGSDAGFRMSSNDVFRMATIAGGWEPHQQVEVLLKHITNQDSFAAFNDFLAEAVQRKPLPSAHEKAVREWLGRCP